MKISLEIIIKILHTAFKSLDQALNAPLIHSHPGSNAYTVFVKYYIKMCTWIRSHNPMLVHACAGIYAPGIGV